MRHDFIDRYSRLDSPVHALDARAKAIALFALIVVCVSTPNKDWWPFAVYAGLVLIIAVASRIPPKYILSRLLIVIPFVIFIGIFLPFMHKGGTRINLGHIHIYSEGLIFFWGIAVKALISISCLILLSSTTPFADLMHGLELLHIPSFLTTVSSFMYRYIFIIVDEAERMARARDSRNFRGRWIWQAKTIGYMIASLFIRSHGRAERVMQAMSSRGFVGKFPRWSEPKMSSSDYIFIALILSCSIAGRLINLYK